MKIVVQKYGGSSVSDLDKIHGVAKRICTSVEAGYSVVVVVSAMGNTTNELIGLAKQVSEDPDRRELDMLISVGERISMSLVAMALRDLGVKARSLTGSQSGILTDGRHADARVLEVRPDRIRQCLERGEVVVVAGFQGVSMDREVTTLGRGGSDTTAVVLAAALGAEHCEICSDVDGVFSADPRLVPNAKKLDVLGLDEAVALSQAGAKVLFEDAVQFARDRGVVLHASSTFGPGSGTRIQQTSPARTGAVAVSSDTLHRVLPVGDDLPLLRASGARIRRIIEGEVWLDVRNLHGGLPKIEGEDRGVVAVVSAIGTGMGERAEVVFALAELLKPARFAASGDVAWWTTEQPSVDLVRVHERLIESA